MLLSGGGVAGTVHVDAPAPVLTGNLDKLRKLVDSKFEPRAAPVKPRRVREKWTDAHNIFSRPGSGKFVAKCLKKPGAYDGPVHAVTGEWTVHTFTRKTGLAAGKEYNTFSGPDGKRYDSLKKARAAGFNPGP